MPHRAPGTGSGHSIPAAFACKHLRRCHLCAKDQCRDFGLHNLRLSNGLINVYSSVWVDYFNGKKTPQNDWLDSAFGNTPVILGDLILTEVLQGFQNHREFKIAGDLLL
jgi:hypothetical protein